MTDHLGSLARFAEVVGVYRTECIMVEDSWFQQGKALPVMVQYDDDCCDGLIRFSPHLDEVDVDSPHGCMTLRATEFLSVLVWLIRQGLLENVGLVSTETASPAKTAPLRFQDDGRDICLCDAETARIQEIADWGIEQEKARRESQAHAEQGRGQRLVTMVADEAPIDEAPAEEVEPELEVPFYKGLTQLVEGAGAPGWLEMPMLMRHLHHDLELSVTDIARLCSTTPARVRGALKRLGIKIVSYRGGRSKIAPRRDAK